MVNLSQMTKRRREAEVKMNDEARIKALEQGINIEPNQLSNKERKLLGIKL